MAEWLEFDGLGGFSMGCEDLIPRRRYHSLLIASVRPPLDRFALLQAVEVFVHLSDYRNFPLSSFCFHPDVIHPKGRDFLKSFGSLPWPTWHFELAPGLTVKYECLRVHGEGHLVLRWKVDSPVGLEATLSVRPLFSGRDYHHLHRERPGMRLIPERHGERLFWTLFDWLPDFGTLTTGRFVEDPRCYYNLEYSEDRARGGEGLEDLASPGFFGFELREHGTASMVWSYGEAFGALPTDQSERLASDLFEKERSRRAQFRSPLEQSSDQFIVKRGAGKTIIAGYPWFTDWGRDTFISLRGLCLATGRFSEAAEILVEWATQVSGGMLPNRFSDHSEEPEYNSVDASLWYVLVCAELLTRAPEGAVLPEQRAKIVRAAELIVEGYLAGTRYGIGYDDETAMLRAGVPGSQLTWMDARIGDYTVTPRIGKPVEIQALWYNALLSLEALGSKLASRCSKIAIRARANFNDVFWNSATGCLNDVIDVDHRRGTSDSSIRPNQLFAVGGLPHALVTGDRARKAVDVCERELLTSAGLRSLAPSDHRYAGRYTGSMRERDMVYHQGTCWYWLIGPFVEAWVRVRESSPEAKRDARERFVQPLLQQFGHSGLPLIPEIADGDPPHRPDGCPTQAWSVAELLRLDLDVLAEK